MKTASVKLPLLGELTIEWHGNNFPVLMSTVVAEYGEGIVDFGRYKLYLVPKQKTYPKEFNDDQEPDGDDPPNCLLTRP